MKYVALSAFFLVCIQVAISGDVCDPGCKIEQSEPRLIEGNSSFVHGENTSKKRKDCATLKCGETCTMETNKKCCITLSKTLKCKGVQMQCERGPLMGYNSPKWDCNTYNEKYNNDEKVRNAVHNAGFAGFKCEEIPANTTICPKKDQNCNDAARWVQPEYNGVYKCTMTFFHEVDGKEQKMKFEVESELKCPKKGFGRK